MSWGEREGRAGVSFTRDVSLHTESQGQISQPSTSPPRRPGCPFSGCLGRGCSPGPCAVSFWGSSRLIHLQIMRKWTLLPFCLCVLHAAHGPDAPPAFCHLMGSWVPAESFPAPSMWGTWNFLSLTHPWFWPLHITPSILPPVSPNGGQQVHSENGKVIFPSCLLTHQDHPVFPLSHQKRLAFTLLPLAVP